MPYPVTARAYLERAKQRLLENTNEAVFYAAFELRCCVEARQEEYASSLEFIKAKIKPWHIGKTAKLLEQVFDSGKIACVTLTLEGSEFISHYTPVSEGLCKSAERQLGGLLHCMTEFKSDDDKFWKRARQQVSVIYRDAWISCQGHLLTPPLQNHSLKFEVPPRALIDLMIQAHKAKTQVKMKIEYLDRASAEWACDL
jgi:hypothetical protein